MRKIRIIAILAVMLVYPSFALSEPIVFIVAGQSTAKCGLVEEVATGDLRTPHQLKEYHVLDMDYSEKPRIVQTFDQRSHFGPEVRFVQLYVKANPSREVILLKMVKNGSGMTRWSPKWPGEYDQWTGDLYRILVDFVIEAVDGRDVEWGGFLFVQGENDSVYPERARAYVQNLRNLVNRLREDLGAPKMPVMTSEVSPVLEKYPHQYQVNQAKINAALTGRDMFVVSNSALGYREDGIHFTSDAVLQLGMRFFWTYRTLLK
ncbi:sialate O-acetylesterase [Syntrophobacter fumaroxidans]|uniref:Sialate O-acetylesterase domain-containing protein n=1 Tax=Syntrophobacter fumaroxidans (strain DSM 10017 / MPOB) TaxID=335543 RepID=A0LNW1_SYNFM|nr:sialate O-acetylesterase [Syntrophobacter fumaroxidans]ABK19113.1 protein of unknown function DUF303, acetylesterase putative [Syntrophobacter fumaroxidans MPOB]